MDEKTKKILNGNVEEIRIETNAEKTWCPGCTNFALFKAFSEALKELILEGKVKNEKIVVVSGIGCHGKVHDYINLTSINALHGRTLPVVFGIKIAKPEMKAIAVSGDGDCYNEGIEHLIHFSRYNIDATLLVYNNQIFALTTGQHTSTTQRGFISKSIGKTKAVMEEPLNPLTLMLSLNTSFVARCFALEIEHTKNVIKEAIMHKGFSFVEILQPCITFNDNREYIKKRIYKIDPQEIDKAMDIARLWNYEMDENAKIPIGIFYKTQKPTFEEKYLRNTYYNAY